MRVLPIEIAGQCPSAVSDQKLVQDSFPDQHLRIDLFFCTAPSHLYILLEWPFCQGFPHENLPDSLDSRTESNIHIKKMSQKPRVVVVGAGPVGCLAACMMENHGWSVDLFEARSGQYFL